MASAAPNNQHKYIVYLGNYAEGVYGLHFDSQTGHAELIGMTGAVKNASWVTSDRDGRFLYAVSELDDGGLASFSIDRKSGKLQKLNSVNSGGGAPCYLAVDATTKALVAANYSTGEVTSFPIKADGSLGEMVSQEKASGKGVDKERQDGPHAHEAVITKDNKRVYAPDLGLDEIRIYKLDAANARLTPNEPAVAKLSGGHGPRHIVFDADEKHAYVLNELKPVVSVFEHDQASGGLTLIQEVATIPASFTGENSGAEIRLAPSGKFLYTSNRGHDSIQVYSIDPAKGTLTQVQIISTEGKVPRGFALDPSGRFLLTGNEKTNNVVIFRVDAQTGKLTPTGQKLDAPSPIDVLFVPAD